VPTVPTFMKSRLEIDISGMIRSRQWGMDERAGYRHPQRHA
jgi:hypothetical protein